MLLSSRQEYWGMHWWQQIMLHSLQTMLQLLRRSLRTTKLHRPVLMRWVVKCLGLESTRWRCIVEWWVEQYWRLLNQTVQWSMEKLGTRWALPRDSFELYSRFVLLYGKALPQPLSTQACRGHQRPSFFCSRPDSFQTCRHNSWIVTVSRASIHCRP